MLSFLKKKGIVAKLFAVFEKKSVTYSSMASSHQPSVDYYLIIILINDYFSTCPLSVLRLTYKW